MGLTRRGLLTGLGAMAATRAYGEAPAVSLRPRLREPDFYKVSIPGGEELVRRSGLTGKVAFAVADARTGQMLETRAPVLPMPPASTAKALTTLYALDRLGANHRFATRLVATGPVTNGRIEGDLVLVGGGDPTLDTDALMSLVNDLKDQGVREVGGTLRVHTGALPTLKEIDDEQPDHVGYNPSVSGLNLNFNRVHFGWERQGGKYRVSMDARSGSVTPDVGVAQMQVVDRSGPIYTYSSKGERDDWTVARSALGGAGARWLPVRYPGLYAGEVFQVLARSAGIMIGGEVDRTDSDAGDVLVTRRSDTLTPILRDMLKYSTNLTAEVMGLSASQTIGAPVTSLADSAERMNGWLKESYAMRHVALEDHSGLGDDSRVTASDMVKAMVGAGADGALRPLMKPFAVDDTRFVVQAKTGTLNFVSALTGYVTGPSGDPLAFAILTGDLDRRDTLTMAQRERPQGGRQWIGASKALQRALLERWGKVYTI